MSRRSARIERNTSETTIRSELTIDGSGMAEISTGIGFLDHMLTALACHGHLDLRLEAKGDLRVDDHHTVEDCALVLGGALDKALAERAGIARFGYAYAPLDEALARAVIDLSGRPACVVELGLRRERLGELSCENVAHFFRSLAVTARASIHVDVLRGDNDHHRVEAAMKAFAMALRQAVRIQPGAAVPSTKGTLS